MTTDADILEFGRRLHVFAMRSAIYSSDDLDVSAVSIAILVAALVVATPDLSPQNRARLFWDEA